MTPWKMVAVVVAAILVASSAVFAGDAAVPGNIPDDFPTLHCIGIRYFIKGDLNANAKVRVKYRRAGRFTRISRCARWKIQPVSSTTQSSGAACGTRD